MCCAVHTSWNCRSKEWNPNPNPTPNPTPNPNPHLVELAVEEVADQRPVLLRWQQPARQRAQRLDRTGGRQACIPRPLPLTPLPSRPTLASFAQGPFGQPTHKPGPPFVRCKEASASGVGSAGVTCQCCAGSEALHLRKRSAV